MKLSLRPTNSGGFTIVETLIVLAIAGLILLIVFQAIPTLQRNSRNNQRKQDATILLQAVSRYELNDSGSMPSSCYGGGLNSCVNIPIIKDAIDKMTYYADNGSEGGIGIFPQIPTTTYVSAGYNNLGNPTDPTYAQEQDLEIQVLNYQRCQEGLSGGDVSNNQGAGFNDVVVIYNLENGNGYTTQCQQL
ncbi:MAG TPA: type II secretion system protein [Candidatus Saccharimonadales bacterium]|jgi:type II secretory pathway pseudopilin PulG|nr:type II secretion system protein [Candidatus Saccharimonadales bacterium]